jgi:hypothetical protein
MRKIALKAQSAVVGLAVLGSVLAFAQTDHLVQRNDQLATDEGRTSLEAVSALQSAGPAERAAFLADVPLLGCGPLLGAGALEGGGPLLGTGPLQGTAPLLSMGPAFGSPTISMAPPSDAPPSILAALPALTAVLSANPSAELPRPVLLALPAPPATAGPQSSSEPATVLPTLVCAVGCSVTPVPAPTTPTCQSQSSGCS